MLVNRYSPIFAACSFAALLLCGCSSTTPPSIVKHPTAPKASVVIPDDDHTAEEYLQMAKSAWIEDGNAQLRNQYLLESATLFVREKDTARAQQILLTLFEDKLEPNQAMQAQALTAACYIEDATLEYKKILSLLTPLAKDPALRDFQLELIARVHQRAGNWLEAANAVSMIQAQDEESVEQIWSWVNRSADQQTAKTFASSLTPYLALRQMLAEHGRNPSGLTKALNQFRRVYRDHPLLNYLPDAVEKAASLTPLKMSEIVVLLPLSGRLEETGQTVKDGIMSAYFEDASTRPERELPLLRFIDTAAGTPEDIAAQIGNTRFVIGPLLKENIDALVPLLSPSTYMLALNRPDSPLSNDVEGLPIVEPAYFSLAPEDEAHQLAEHIFNRGYRTPIVVSAQSSIYQRMLEAFETRWQELNKQRGEKQLVGLTTLTFTDSNSLKDSVTSALDVAQSHKRIDQVRYMVNEELYNVPRSRQDLDAIIVFASPEQTELLNPMVEASLSPFSGNAVPVYATSRSIEYDSSKNQWRDLQNVRFLDMPWMMPDNQWRELASQSDKLWPDRNTQYSRLFAFGVDAYHLLPEIRSLALLPQVSVSGLTGELSMNARRDIIRMLPQAKIDNEQIIVVSKAP